MQLWILPPHHFPFLIVRRPNNQGRGEHVCLKLLEVIRHDLGQNETVRRIQVKDLMGQFMSDRVVPVQ